MNQEKAPSSPSKKRLPAVFYPVIALLAVILLVFWRSHSAMKDRLQTLSERNAALEEQLASSESRRPAQPRRTEPAAEERAAAPVAKPPAKAPETIKLLTPAVEATPAGLTARLEFQPDASHGPPDVVALVVRIPKDAGARIVAFDAVNESDYSDIRKRVDDEGRFAIFQGSPDALEKLRFDLTVSGPVTATVRGSKGIRAFEITLDGSSPVVRRL